MTRSGGGTTSKKQRDQKETIVRTGEKEKNVRKIYRIKYEKYLRIKPNTNSPFDTLIAASQVMFMFSWHMNSNIYTHGSPMCSHLQLNFFAIKVTNAEQFKLPQEMEVHENLPFSWKWSDEARNHEVFVNGGANGDAQR